MNARGNMWWQYDKTREHASQCDGLPKPRITRGCCKRKALSATRPRRLCASEPGRHTGEMEKGPTAQLVKERLDFAITKMFKGLPHSK
jgi:hypothetical protein